jgi:hypothetical protein
MTYDFDEADDLTPGPHDLTLTPGVITDAAFEFSSDILGDLSTVAISFTPATELLTEYGTIQITAPVWYSRYDSDSKSMVDVYTNGDEDFGCMSRNFSSFGAAIEDGLISITYDAFLLEKGETVTIECLNWRNPILPGVYSGHQVETLDGELNFIDRSEDVSLNAEDFKAGPLNDELITYALDVAFSGEVSSYSISFEADLALNIRDGCYVKYTFPSELDVTGMDLETLAGEGLLLDSDGQSSSSVLKYSMLEKTDGEDSYIVLEGCQFDPVGKSDAELEKFSSTEFKVALSGIKNPSEIAETSPLSIEVFKTWNSTTATPETLLTYTLTSVISASHFQHESGQLELASITTSNATIGAEEGNIATITFTVGTDLPRL